MHTHGEKRPSQEEISSVMQLAERLLVKRGEFQTARFLSGSHLAKTISSPNDTLYRMHTQ